MSQTLNTLATYFTKIVSVQQDGRHAGLSSVEVAVCIDLEMPKANSVIWMPTLLAIQSPHQASSGLDRTAIEVTIPGYSPRQGHIKGQVV